MGYLFCCHSIVLPKPLLRLVLILDCVRCTICAALSYLGLYPSSETHGFSLADLIKLPSVPTTPSLIKMQLRVVRARSLLKRFPGAFQGKELTCAVCLGCLEEMDEVRELRNCCHVFHRGCIDQWVDVGGLTCPMCRSNLLPQEHYKGRIGAVS